MHGVACWVILFVSRPAQQQQPSSDEGRTIRPTIAEEKGQVSETGADRLIGVIDQRPRPRCFVCFEAPEAARNHGGAGSFCHS